MRSTKVHEVSQTLVGSVKLNCVKLKYKVTELSLEKRGFCVQK